jgi:hypothetical protein
VLHGHTVLQGLLQTWPGVVSVAAEAFSLLAMAPHLLLEIYSIIAYKWQWLSSWNTVDVLTYINQAGTTLGLCGDLHQPGRYHMRGV